MALVTPSGFDDHGRNAAIGIRDSNSAAVSRSRPHSDWHARQWHHVPMDGDISTGGSSNGADGSGGSGEDEAEEGTAGPGAPHDGTERGIEDAQLGDAPAEPRVSTRNASRLKQEIHLPSWLSSFRSVPVLLFVQAALSFTLVVTILVEVGSSHSLILDLGPSFASLTRTVHLDIGRLLLFVGSVAIVGIVTLAAACTSIRTLGSGGRIEPTWCHVVLVVALVAPPVVVTTAIVDLVIRYSAVTWGAILPEWVVGIVVPFVLLAVVDVIVFIRLAQAGLVRLRWLGIGAVMIAASIMAVVALGAPPFDDVHAIDFWVAGPDIPTGLYDNITSLSCPTTDVCLAAAHGFGTNERNRWALARFTSSPPQIISSGQAELGFSGISTLACVSGLVCLAIVGDHDTPERTTDGGATFVPVDLPQISGEYYNFRCDTNRLCYAVSQSSLYISDDTGSTWHLLFATAPPPPLGGPRVPLSSRPLVNSILSGACPGQSECFVLGAVDAAGEEVPSSFAEFTLDYGQSWEPSSMPRGLAWLGAARCVSVSTCYAVGAIPWIGSPTGLSCFAPQECFATGVVAGADVGGGGPYVLGNDRSLVMASSDGGTTWRVVLALPAGSKSGPMSCPTAAICTVALSSDFPMSPALTSTRDGGHTWVSMKFPRSPTG